MKGNEGIWILSVGDFPLISLPPKLMPVLGDAAKLWSRAMVGDPEALLRALAPLHVEKLVGPAFIGFAMENTLVVPSGPKARPLSEADVRAVDELRASCTPLEWEHGGSAIEENPSFGAFDEDGCLAALASYKKWNRRIAHLYVITAPHRRSGGFGSAVVGLAARSAMDLELVPQYRTLMSNSPSMRVAEKLGFEQYGFSVYLKVQI